MLPIVESKVEVLSGGITGGTASTGSIAGFDTSHTANIRGTLAFNVADTASTGSISAASPAHTASTKYTTLKYSQNLHFREHLCTVSKTNFAGFRRKRTQVHAPGSGNGIKNISGGKHSRYGEYW